MRGEAPEGVMGLLAVSGKPTDIFRVGLGKALPSQRSHEPPPVVDVLFYLLLGYGYRPGLEACYAVEPPREQRHALREGELQVPDRGEVLEDALAVLLPVLGLLQAGDHRCWGAYAVAGGVPFHHLLACLSNRSSLAHAQTSFTKTDRDMRFLP